MLYIVTETHYEYNDETYESPDAKVGQEPGTPVSYWQDRKDADADAWNREIRQWQLLSGSLASYLDGFCNWVYFERDGSRYENDKHHSAEYAEFKELKTKLATLFGQSVDDIKLDYEFELPNGLTTDQMKEVVLLLNDGHRAFFNVFELP
ncbi:MAG: hypothetical protein JSS66_05980 [Armatimonadetes bacterium]|nr:hypothetical protein [Armatimonadota bacterium]